MVFGLSACALSYLPLTCLHRGIRLYDDVRINDAVLGRDLVWRVLFIGEHTAGLYRLD